ncbi:formimidoylglutamate deiminase [Corallococcus sp. H22C18031201]|uniref:formimidoylglutamate deiminase n=1 Tax=Citreicoccus inhibens TaxID=2849499 RepID=UPI000E71EB85|nr:formimidoylglutamate deiminase [Citreicoccus inhibens]MBU8896367.1 formimidoylglutamate deiminase [Citreicoccus inhibens]RJS17315.1 formimidoylglutamate deiminase [Corallococcus sp. H22C18031201]
MSDITVYQPDFLYTEGRLQAGRSLAVSAQGDILADAGPGARVVRLPGRALLPGLVNGHSHAFQRLIRGRTEYVAGGRGQDDFWSWREAMYRAAEALSPEELHVASRQVFLEMALAGITSVGEFHYVHHQPDGTPYVDRNELAHAVIRAARDVGLRICLLRVGYARAGHGVPPNPRQRRFIDPDVDTFLSTTEALASAARADSAVSVGLAPHSVRAVPRAWLEALARSSPRGMPVHMHVAEQPKEIEASLAEHGRRPTELLADVGLLGPSFTAVHGVHLTDEEVSMLGQSKSTVCACPSTERNLGDGIVPADALVAAGAHVSFGSDSQTIVDLLDEARQVEQHLRLARLRRAVLDPGSGTMDGLASRLLDMATVEGARSLGMRTGKLEPGRPADFFTVDLEHPSLVGADPTSLLPGIMFGASSGAIRDVVVAGRSVVSNGHHALARESGQAFQVLARKLYS